MDVAIRFTDSPRVFGALLVPQRAAIVARVGADTFARALARVPHVVRDEYDVAPRRHVVSERDGGRGARRGRARSGARREGSRRVVRARRDHGDGGAALARAARHEQRRRAPRSHAALLREGSRRVVRSLTAARVGRGHSELSLEGWPDVPELHAVGIGAGVRAVLMLAGRRDVTVDFRRDVEPVRFDVAWRA